MLFMLHRLSLPLFDLVYVASFPLMSWDRGSAGFYSARYINIKMLC